MKKLDLDMLKKIERELFLEHGMSIKLSIEHFQKFTNALKKNSHIDVKKFEKDCINKIIKVKKRDDKYNVIIHNTIMTDLILELFSESETRKIISSLLENEYTIPQILKESKVPKTSGYRKIENLILNGIIIESGKVLSESKKISKLQCVFQEIKLDIKKEKITITGIVSKKMFEKSTSMKSIIESFN
jgi:tRNA A37 threonylcarbamoyladenosine synthetase subunit TsaC/SUA5/YrdC